MITEKNNVFYCDCGFSFQRGRSGAHDCADGLRNKLAALEARCAALAAENARMKAAIPQQRNVEFDNDNMDDVSLYEDFGFNDAIGRMRVAVSETPATDAFLAEVRASGVEMFASVLESRGRHQDYVEIANAYAAQLRKGVQS